MFLDLSEKVWSKGGSGLLGMAFSPSFVRPEPAHVVTEAVGIGRHARFPDNARILVKWLVGDEAQREHSKMPGFYPSNARVSSTDNRSVPATDRNAGVAGAFDVDAIKLAERAGWR